MASDAWLLGVAILLTLLTAAALFAYESFATRRGRKFRRFERPGATALVVGFSLAALLTGEAAHSWFVLPVAAFAALSGTAVLRFGGRITSFLILWCVAVLVVFALGAQLPAYGVRVPDVVFTGLLLACFASLIRELDIVGSFGWATAEAFAIGAAAIAYVSNSAPDEGMALLVAGAVFAVIAVSPFGAGMLGRVGSRLAGLVIGALAIRASVGSPVATTVVVAVGVLCALGYVLTLESPARRRVLLGAGLLTGAGAVASAPAVLALLDVYRPIHRAVTASRGLVNAKAGQLGGTSARLAAVQESFGTSADRLDRPAVTVGRGVPFLSANLRGATESAHVAADLAGSARELIDRANVNAAAIHGATVDRQSLVALASQLRRVQADVRDGLDRIGSGEGDELLVPELRTGLDDLRAQVRSVAKRITTTLHGTQVAESLLGYDRPRRFFIAVQNNAESRATGGYVGNYGILVADGGHVTLPDFRRTSEFDAPGAPPRTLNAPREYSRRYSRFDVAREWTNVNMSPDMPTVARVMADQYKQFSGTDLDGVIAVDPIALSYLLRLTGPVQVAGWPTAITADNVVNITLHDEYIAYENQLDSRIDFIGRVAKIVFERLTNGGLRDLTKAGDVVHAAVASGHLQFWSAESVAQRFFVATNAAGAVPPVRGDALLVTTQNDAGNKVDFWLHRDINYTARVRRAGDAMRVGATVTIKLRNDAPESGEPRYAIGPHDGRFRAGQNRLYLTVYSPLPMAQASVDGAPVEIEGASELGRFAHSVFIDVPAGATRTLVFRLTGDVRGNGRYVLDVAHQPLVHDDAFSFHVTGLGAPRSGSAVLTKHFRVIIPA